MTAGARCLLFLTASALVACSQGEGPPPGAPAAATLPSWLAARQAAQRADTAGFGVEHDFRFVDGLATSGITYLNQIVDDAGKTYKKVHYDHGTGLAAADVDGDGKVDLYFVSQRGSSELWKNQGGGRFVAWTDSAGLRMPDAIAVGASFADTDNDGDPDLFVTTVRHGNRLYENRGGGRFTDISAAAGVDYSGHSSGAVFFDYDQDGLLDLLVTNVGVYTTDTLGAGGFRVGLEDAFRGHLHPERSEPSILYRNLGGNRFRDVSRQTGLVDLSWSGDATILDVNDDGRPDLYLPNMQGRNHLWLNLGGRFRDASAEYFPVTPWGAMGVKAFDWNGDQRLDLLVTDMHSDMFTNIPPEDAAGENRKSDPAGIPPDFFADGSAGLLFGNALYTSLGQGKYAEQSDSAGAENYWPWGPSSGDLNADGWQDVFIVSSMNFPHRYAVNALLLNDQGRRFRRAEFLLGVEPRADGMTEQPWFVLDCAGADRNNRFCVACSAPAATPLPECRRRDAAGRLTMMGSVGARSAILLDLDGDGDQDIVTNEFNGPPRILLNDLSTRHPVHALSVRLRGSASNREGIGASVTVTLADGRRLFQVHDGKSGYLSQSDVPLYFGFGSAERATAIEVRWPSGRIQTVPGPIAAGQTLEIVEP